MNNRHLRFDPQRTSDSGLGVERFDSSCLGEPLGEGVDTGTGVNINQAVRPSALAGRNGFAKLSLESPSSYCNPMGL